MALGLCAARPGVAVEGPYASVATRIAVHLNERLSSQDARAGDPFTFDTSSSVEVAGMFLPARTHGRGVVVYARAAKGPQPGVLVLDARTLDLPDGKPLAVGLAPGALNRSIPDDVRSYPGVRNNPAQDVPFAIGGSRATNVVYEKGTEFVVVTPPPPTPAPAAT